MTPSAAFWRWLQEGPIRERRTTAAVTIVATALVTLALVPAPNDRHAGLLIDEAFPASQGPGVAVIATAPDADAGPFTEATAAPVADPALPTAASTVTTQASGGGRIGPSGPLTATDRGVSADAIKVGFATVSFAGASELGFVNGLRTDASEVVDALVDHANDRGGVLGRRIEPVKVSVDLIRRDDQRQKCVELTETHGVFAVIDSIAFAWEPSTACIAAEHDTLLINGNPGSSANVRLGFPYLVSVHKDDNRKVKDQVVAAKAAGFFDPANGFEHLGIFEDACSPAIFDSPTDGMHAHLRATGVTRWSRFRVDCDPASFQRGAAEAVLRFRQDGVTHVLLAAHPPAVDAYLSAAGRGRYYPEYFAGDYFNLVAGAFVADYEPEGFDGALGVTQTHAGEGAVGKPLPPLSQTCSDIFVDHGLAPVSSAPPDDIGDDIEVLELCESFSLFLQVANAAGPNLTRATWVDALAGVGDFRAATTDLARFDRPGKTTGGDTMKLVQWHRSCRCWKELTEFGPAAG